MIAEDREAAAWHVETVASRNRVKVRFTRTLLTAEAVLLTRQAFVPKITRGIEYLAALHEIGHICDRSARSWHERPGVRSEMMNEAAAWGWAVEHADPYLLSKLNAADWRHVGALWATYCSSMSPPPAA